MKRTTVRVGSAREFFERGRAYARRDRSAVTREIAQLQRFGLVRVDEAVLPGHGRMKKVSAVAGEIRLEAIIG